MAGVERTELRRKIPLSTSGFRSGLGGLFGIFQESRTESLGPATFMHRNRLTIKTSRPSISGEFSCDRRSVGKRLHGALPRAIISL